MAEGSTRLADSLGREAVAPGPGSVWVPNNTDEIGDNVQRAEQNKIQKEY